MLLKSLRDITLADIETLRVNRVLESAGIDFKAAPIGNGDRDRREFLADVSAFANASGGDIVLGVKTKDGAADEIAGIVLADADKEKLRLGDIIRSGLEPRLSTVDYAWLPIEGARGIMIIRVPRSWTAPHRVTYLKDMNFYVRNPAGKHPMSIDELRQAFAFGASTADRVREFRDERIRAIETRDIPFDLKQQPIVAIHFVPLSAIVDPADLQFDISDEGRVVRPVSRSGSSWQHALEGFGTYSVPTPPEAYSLMFRNGAVECVAPIPTNDGHAGISLYRMEDAVLYGWRLFKAYAANVGIEPPIYVFVSLLGIKGLAPPRGIEITTPARNDVIQLAAVVIDAANFEQDPSIVFKRCFYTAANAFGLPRSPNYDADGNKRP